MALSIVGTGGGEREKDGGGRPAAHGRTDVGTTENKNKNEMYYVKYV